MAADGRVITVGDSGETYQLTKEVGEKFIYSFSFQDWLAGRGTVTSVGTVTILPASPGTPPTGVAATSGFVVSLTLDAGTSNWNTSGTGTLSFVVTMSNGEKKEINCTVTITA